MTQEPHASINPVRGQVFSRFQYDRSGQGRSMKILGQGPPDSLGPGLDPADIRLQDLSLFV